MVKAMSPNFFYETDPSANQWGQLSKIKKPATENCSNDETIFEYSGGEQQNHPLNNRRGGNRNGITL